MEFDSVIRGRRSIRASTGEAVPEELIREILDAACWAPAWRTTQAWNVWVLSGDALQRYKDEFRAAVERDDPAALDLPATAEWPQACSARIAATMKSRAATLEAAGEPADSAAALARMANLFGAPCLLVLGFDNCLVEAYAGFDTGSLVRNVCLAAFDRGLGICIVATVIRYPGILRCMLPDAEGKRFVVSVTLDHPVADSPVNTFARSRAGLDELVTWLS